MRRHSCYISQCPPLDSRYTNIRFLDFLCLCSDTWIDPTSPGVTLPPGLVDTGYNTSTSYVDHTVASGSIVLANVSFGPYTVYNQAINVVHNVTKGNPLNGLLGLGGYSGDSVGFTTSEIYSTLANTTYAGNGVPIVYNIFEHRPDLPNYTTDAITSGGVFTVSEVLSDLTAILDSPRLNTVLVDQWGTFLDGVYVNGQFLNGHSKYENRTLPTALQGTPAGDVAEKMIPPPGRTLADFDTGTSGLYGPPAYLHAIYGDIPGVPCDTKLNISWSINGILYPMHPIDAITVNVDEDGSLNCLSSMFGGTTADQDWLLGDAFLRNVYILYGYGDTEGGLAAQQPYTQLLSRTDPDKAWLEFDSLLLKQLLYNQKAYATSLAPHSSFTSIPVYTNVPSTVTLTEIMPTPGSSSQAQGAGITSAISSDFATATSGVVPNDNLAVAGAAAEASSDSSGKVDSVGGQALTPTFRIRQHSGRLKRNTDSTLRCFSLSPTEAPLVLAPPVVGSDLSLRDSDLSNLTRNSYIILGLLAVVLVMLLVTVGMMIKAGNANAGYRTVPTGNLAHAVSSKGKRDSLYASSYAEGGQ
ncbi:hypothetical protein BN946_scf184668.g2 [Trametes cinnabarina]|uniref:Peptidase A1 domain-containing protein n=1 Tax=Pycnoporus cinnabarinus TaxID=5643 RepID=A0A060SZ97_PYCCI|nr:hypothetical protein BN946_scf184668.g2 [Trametes cinnabarina]